MALLARVADDPEALSSPCCGDLPLSERCSSCRFTESERRNFVYTLGEE